MDGFFDFMDLRSDEKRLCELPIIGIDVETTGLEASSNQIIEIGIASYDFESRSSTALFSSFVNPRRSLTETVRELTGITDEQLSEAPEFSQIADQVSSYLSSCMIVAHNAEFDLSFLYQVLGKNLLEKNDCVVFDTLKISRRLIRSSRYSLEFLIESLGLDHKNHHRALDDAQMSLALFDHLIHLDPGYKNSVVSKLLETLR